MLREGSEGRDNARCLYVCGNCQCMAHIAIHVTLHTRIRAFRPSMCNVVCNAFGHLIRAPHYFQTFGQIGFLYGLMTGIGPHIFSVPSPPPPMAWRSRSRTWKFIVEVLVVKMPFPNESFWSTVSNLPKLKKKKKTFIERPRVCHNQTN